MRKRIESIREGIGQNPYVNRYFGEPELRMRMKLHFGMIINLGYGIFQMIIGVLYESVWFGALAVYYVTLSLIQGVLIVGDRGTRRIEEETKRLEKQWKTHRVCGIMLLGLNVTMSGIAIQMIWENRGYRYPGTIIYAMATYTFYRLTVAIIRILRKRMDINPVLSASKALDLSIAMMSILALQTAMFDAFGTDESLERLMNTLTGTGIFILVICLALFMIVQSTILLIQGKRAKKDSKKE